MQEIYKGAAANDKTGTPARTAAQIINDNFKYLDNKITRKDGIVVSTGYAGTPEDKIMNIYWEWIIDAIDYTNPAPVPLNFPYAASGKMRLDMIALTTSNTAIRIAGPESDSNPVSAPLPDNMIQAGLVLVTDSEVGEPSSPVIGDLYVKKLESQDVIVNYGATTVIEQINLTDDRSSISLIGSATDVKSVQVSGLYIRMGKPHFFKNRTGHPVKLWHLAGTGNIKYFFPNGLDLIVKPNEVIEFNTNANDSAYVRFERVGGDISSLYDSLLSFSGVFDLSRQRTGFYSDYISGSIVNLSLSSVKIFGAVATVRIKGNLLGTIPVGWNLSGQPIINVASKMNELTIMYVSDSDIRLVNRVVSYTDVVPPSVPANLIEVSKTTTTISVSWDASTDDVSVTGYNVYVNGVYNSFTTTTNKTITGLTLSTVYLLSVSAIDSSANESAKTTALSITTNAVDTYETEYQAVLDYATANGFDLPDSTQKTKDNNKVKYLKAVGAWSALDTVRIFNSTYSPTSWATNMYRLNFKNPALYPLTAVAGLEPSFASGSGFNITGGSGKYAKTGFIPSSHAVNFGGSNCSEIMGLFNIPSTFSTNVWITGGRSSSGDAGQILVGATVNGSLIFRLGSTGTVFTVAQTDLNAHFHCYKSAGAIKLFRNGLTEMAASSSVGIGTTVSTTEQYILGANDNGTLLSSAMNVGMKYHLMGSSLDTKKNEIYQIMNETYVP